MEAMTRSEFISKLWEVCVGDKEAMEFLTDNYMKMQNIINKVIEYAESSSFDVNTKDYGMLCVCNTVDVLDILKEVE